MFIVLGIMTIVGATSILSIVTVSGNAVSSSTTEAIVFGVVAIIIGLVGVCSACFRSKPVLMFYAVIMLVLMVVHFYYGGKMFQYANDRNGVRDSLSQTWDAQTKIGRMNIQTSFSCCGFDSTTDRQAETCPADSGPCGPILVDSSIKALKNTGAFLIVGGIAELGAAIVALVIAFNQNHLRSGYGKYYGK
jgi:hypothetical protein